MDRKPLIGITKPDRKGNFAYAFIWIAVYLSGGKPQKITTLNTGSISNIDGLILGGGNDIFPALFQDEPKPKKDYEYDHERDELELFWLRKADNDSIPVIGICRGAQLMNVAEGGGLHMSVSKNYDRAEYPSTWLSYLFYRKRINIRSGSLLHSVLRTGSIKVNSIHKQAISKVARALVVTAEEENGVIQSVEKQEHPFYIGVQFHPEFLIYRKPFRLFFKSFIEASYKHMP